jgi:IS5 family transposase
MGWPGAYIEASLAPLLARQARPAKRVINQDLLGVAEQEFGAGISPAGRPRLPVRLMVSLMYLKNSMNLGDEELVER